VLFGKGRIQQLAVAGKQDTKIKYVLACVSLPLSPDCMALGDTGLYHLALPLLPWGSALAELTCLQVLHLEHFKLAPADALLLRTFTGLFELQLIGAKAGLDETVVAALTVQLTQLVELRRSLSSLS
jgi:hypothetical protein